MPPEHLSYLALPRQAINANDTTPNPGKIGAVAWSTTLQEVVRWDGASWQIPGATAPATIPSVLTLEDTSEQINTDTSGVKLHSYDLIGSRRLAAAGANSDKELRLQPSLREICYSHAYLLSAPQMAGTGIFNGIMYSGTTEPNTVSTGDGGPASGVLRGAVKTAATAGSNAGYYANSLNLYFTRHAGFLVTLRFGYGGLPAQQFAAGYRAFAGVWYQASLPANADMTTYQQSIGICANAGETNWSTYFSYTGGSGATKTALGSDFPVGLTHGTNWAASFYELTLRCPRGVDRIDWRLRALHNTPNTSVSGSFTNGGHLPAPTRVIYPVVWVNNGALTAQPSTFMSYGYAETYNF